MLNSLGLCPQSMNFVLKKTGFRRRKFSGQLACQLQSMKKHDLLPGFDPSPATFGHIAIGSDTTDIFVTPIKW